MSVTEEEDLLVCVLLQPRQARLLPVLVHIARIGPEGFFDPAVVGDICKE